MPLSSDDFLFELDNLPVKLVAVRKIPRMETSGLLLKGYEENEEFTANLWIAKTLVESGVARFTGEEVEMQELSRIHYMERIQPLERLMLLPARFYQRVYLTLSEMRRSVRGDMGRIEIYSKFVGMLRDILESRIRKIVRLASLGTPTDQTRSLTPEEKVLFEEVSTAISSWRSKMLRLAEA